MIYSVYNPGSRSYDYYQTSDVGTTTHTGAPSRSILASSVGASPEQAAWTLPIGASKIGSGTAPRGRIASRGSLVPFAGMSSEQLPWLALIAGGAYLWWTRRRRS